jgi:hypothetical protein
MSIEFSGDPFGPSFVESIPITSTHASAGLHFKLDPARDRLCLLAIEPGTPAARINRWRSRLRFAYILSINDIDIRTQTDIDQALATLRAAGTSVCDIRSTFDEIRNSLSASGLPQLYFDQLRDVRKILRSLRETPEPAIAHRLTRPGLKKQPDCSEWQSSEFLQIDNYEYQGMFGTPCAPLPGHALFHWVWLYKIKEKENDLKKARAVCDGFTRGGQAQVQGQTYAPTPDMTDLRLFFALATLEGKLVFGADVSNAFAEADAPAQSYSMRVDVQFREWWANKGRPPIPAGYVVPILKNLQGHPEAPRQWSKHIDAILHEFNFVPTRHAPCIYRATIEGEDVLFLRQVDDFAIATNNAALYNRICDSLDSKLLVPMKRQGLLTHYNGIDIIQSSDHITLHCGTYIRKIVANHGWSDMHAKHLPMSSENEHIHALDTAEPPSTAAGKLALENAHFRYRGAIGELIWAIITCRPEISKPVCKLSQFSTTPAKIHYDATRHIFSFLAGTQDYGLTYWHKTPHPSLPKLAAPPLLTAPSDRHMSHDTSEADAHSTPTALVVYVDSDWVADIRHRRSISGIIFKLTGAAIAWKCRVQTTISLSTSEAEYLAASDAGKMALYLRSVLEELHVPQNLPRHHYL